MGLGVRTFYLCDIVWKRVIVDVHECESDGQEERVYGPKEKEKEKEK